MFKKALNAEKCKDGTDKCDLKIGDNQLNMKMDNSFMTRWGGGESLSKTEYNLHCLDEFGHPTEQFFHPFNRKAKTTHGHLYEEYAPEVWRANVKIVCSTRPRDCVTGAHHQSGDDSCQYSNDGECDVPNSNPHESMPGNGAGYRGYQTQTRSGRTCQSWNSQSPHSHTRTQWNYPSSGLGWHNYCRNPDGEPTIWCYTSDGGSRWEYCDPLPAHPAKHCAAGTDATDCNNADGVPIWAQYPVGCEVAGKGGGSGTYRPSNNPEKESDTKGAVWTVEAARWTPKTGLDEDEAHCNFATDATCWGPWKPLRQAGFLNPLIGVQMNQIRNCVLCPAGMYSEGTGNCIYCPSGKFQQNPGRVDCDECGFRCGVAGCAQCDVWGNCPPQGLDPGFCFANDKCINSRSLSAYPWYNSLTIQDYSRPEPRDYPANSLTEVFGQQSWAGALIDGTRPPSKGFVFFTEEHKGFFHLCRCDGCKDCEANEVEMLQAPLAWDGSCKFCKQESFPPDPNGYTGSHDNGFWRVQKRTQSKQRDMYLYFTEKRIQPNGANGLTYWTTWHNRDDNKLVTTRELQIGDQIVDPALWEWGSFSEYRDLKKCMFDERRSLVKESFMQCAKEACASGATIYNFQSLCPNADIFSTSSKVKTIPPYLTSNFIERIVLPKLKYEEDESREAIEAMYLHREAPDGDRNNAICIAGLKPTHIECCFGEDCDVVQCYENAQCIGCNKFGCDNKHGKIFDNTAATCSLKHGFTCAKGKKFCDGKDWKVRWFCAPEGNQRRRLATGSKKRSRRALRILPIGNVTADVHRRLQSVGNEEGAGSMGRNEEETQSGFTHDTRKLSTSWVNLSCPLQSV
jgi:hypothetical protein